MIKKTEDSPVVRVETKEEKIERLKIEIVSAEGRVEICRKCIECDMASGNVYELERSQLLYNQAKGRLATLREQLRKMYEE